MSIRIEDLANTDLSSVTVAGGKRIAPTPPGAMLRDEFLKPMGLTNYRLAKEIDVPAQRIGDIIAGKRGITADTDLRLCRCGCRAITTRASREARLPRSLRRSNPGRRGPSSNRHEALEGHGSRGKCPVP
jgi:addiction module HigA family antidote